VTGLAEVTGALRAACGEGPGLTSRVERARVSAISLADRADSHGWTGVAASMRGAVDALGSVVAELVESQRAGVAALAQLDLIDDQGSAEQVSVDLIGARRELATAVQKIDAVTVFVDVALHACAQAGQRGLPAALTALRVDAVEMRGRLEESKNACDQERVLIEAWLQANPDQGTASGGSAESSTPAASGTVAAASTVQPTAPAPSPSQASSSTVTSLEARESFDQLIDPAGRTLLPREAPDGTDARLQPEEGEDIRRADDIGVAPEDGLTRRTRRALAWTAAGTIIGQSTIGAVLEFGSSLGQAIGTAIFGAAAMIIEGPAIVKTLRETRNKKPTKPGSRKRAHGN
jgi:hypothetical protein